jgi:hypothetical protein
MAAIIYCPTRMYSNYLTYNATQGSREVERKVRRQVLPQAQVQARFCSQCQHAR